MGKTKPGFDLFAFADRRAEDTRLAALKSVKRSASMLRYQVLGVIRGSGNHGMTAQEAAHALEKSEFSVRPRVTELAQGGDIQDSGARRRNASGANATVWVAR